VRLTPSDGHRKRINVRLRHTKDLAPPYGYVVAAIFGVDRHGVVRVGPPERLSFRVGAGSVTLPGSDCPHGVTARIVLCTIASRRLRISNSVRNASACESQSGVQTRMPQSPD